MVVFPNAKINIGLHITSKRTDGFHNIETIFYPIPLTDVLEIIPTLSPGEQKIIFTSYGIEIPGNADDNLCLKAYNILDKEFNLPPVKMVLQKNIPMGAGLGGGSSDAAFTLILLNKLFNLGLNLDQLMNLASTLGSDCAFFIKNEPALGLEKGNLLENIELKMDGYYMILVKPDIHVGTAEAYSGVVPQIPSVSLKQNIRLPIEEWKSTIINDFEKSIFEKHTEIKHIKEVMYKNGALYASMTGSGAAVYGLFKNELNLKTSFINKYYWGTWI